MVLHSHMLNPRAFLEDCLRFGLRGLWLAGMPWRHINAAIDTDFNYNVSDDGKTSWTAKTDRQWENQDDEMVKKMKCPYCSTALSIPWTTCGLDETYKGDKPPGLIGSGYGDGKLDYQCSGCSKTINKELLSVVKFVTDSKALFFKTYPMPGTILDLSSGMPELPPISELQRQILPRTFPNRMITKKLRSQVLGLVTPSSPPGTSMERVKQLIERVLDDDDTVRAIDGFDTIADKFKRYALGPSSKMVVRKMMSRYWENFSPFALDLCGAVMRQGIFVEKMYRIDWLHSPSASPTMQRLLGKYHRFFSLMAANTKKVCVPTLDIDLAWHTHQLSPAAYYKFSKAKTLKFIDHDDKIDEEKLSTSFEWTSKAYQEAYGEVYSECTCWYCESRWHKIPKYISICPYDRNS
jgi:hypothetical protein